MELLDLNNPPHLDDASRAGTPSSKALQEEQRRLGPDSVATGLLLLWHDRWEAAHAIAQADEGDPDHDLLHAIAHRREGDYGNAGYWFRRTGTHPCFAGIPARVEPLIAENPRLLRKLLPGGKWDAHAFLDAVRRGEQPELLRKVQAQEMRAFFEWLVR